MPAKPSLLFRATGMMAALFVLTVFVMVAALFSDPDLPINQWLNHYSLHLLLGEVGLLIALGVSAMVTDRPAITAPDQGSEQNDQGSPPVSNL